MRSVIVLLCSLFMPIQLLAEGCTWDSKSPTVIHGTCNTEGILNISTRSGPTHTVKITNRGRSDGKFTVYESDGCSDKSRYSFCKGKGWSLAATPVDLGNGKVGLLSASHFGRPLTEDMALRDIAIFLPGHYELKGKLTELKTVPVYNSDPLKMSAYMSVDIRRDKTNIPLDVNAVLRPVEAEGKIKFWGSKAPDGMSDHFGGESGASFLIFGSVVAVFTGFIENQEWEYSLMTVVPASNIQRLIEKASSAGPEVPFVMLD